MNDSPIKPHRFRRRALVIVAALLLGAIFGQFILLPRMARRQIVAACAQFGYDSVSFELPRATLWGVELKNVQLGGGPLPPRIERVVVRFTPASLWGGRLTSACIDGLRLTVSETDGGGFGTRRDTTASATQPAERMGNLPFESLEIVDSTITIPTGEGERDIQIAGTFARGGDKRFALNVAATLGGGSLTLSGDYDDALEAGKITLHGQSLAAADITAFVSALHPQQAFQGGGTLDISARATLTERRVFLEATLQPRDVWVGPSEDAANIQALSGVLQCAADIDGAANESPAVSNLRVTAQSASFRSRAYDLSCEEIDANLALKDLLSPTTDDIQRLTVSRLTFGEVELVDGSIDFAMDGWRAILVSQTAWSWLGGSVSSRDVRIDSQTQRVALTLTVDKVELKQLLDLLAKDRATGDGNVSGEIPLVIDWPKVTFGNGELRAAGNGRLIVVDAAALDQMIPPDAGTVREQAKARQNVVEAMKDFEYKTLVARLENDADGLTADVHMAGRGRTGQRQAIELDLRIRGLDRLLAAYLGLRERISPAN